MEDGAEKDRDGDGPGMAVKTLHGEECVDTWKGSAGAHSPTIQQASSRGSVDAPRSQPASREDTTTTVKGWSNEPMKSRGSPAKSGDGGRAGGNQGISSDQMADVSCRSSPQAGQGAEAITAGVSNLNRKEDLIKEDLHFRQRAVTVKHLNFLEAAAVDWKRLAKQLFCEESVAKLKKLIRRIRDEEGDDDGECLSSLIAEWQEMSESHTLGPLCDALLNIGYDELVRQIYSRAMGEL